jgi:hypothetical protein
VKARMLGVLLLLSACTDSGIVYDYALNWVCISPGTCERTEEVMLIDRLNTTGDTFFFNSTRNEPYFESAQRVVSDAVPAGCYLLYGFTLFGHELEPSNLCRTSGGFELELSIPNRDTATHSEWLVEIRKL